MIILLLRRQLASATEQSARERSTDVFFLRLQLGIAEYVLLGKDGSGPEERFHSLVVALDELKTLYHASNVAVTIDYKQGDLLGCTVKRWRAGRGKAKTARPIGHPSTFFQVALALLTDLSYLLGLEVQPPYFHEGDYLSFFEEALPDLEPDSNALNSESKE